MIARPQFSVAGDTITTLSAGLSIFTGTSRTRFTIREETESDEFIIDTYRFRRCGDQELRRGETVGGVDQTGFTTQWTLTGVPGVDLTIGDTRWLNGEREVATLNVDAPLPSEIGGPQPLAILESKMRQTVLESGDTRYVEANTAVVKDDDTMSSSLRRASRTDLEVLAGATRLDDLFREHGATSWGTRAEVIGDSGRRRDNLAVAFEGTYSSIPVVVYALTRVVPLLKLDVGLHEDRARRLNIRRVYVVELTSDPERPSVYVGETGRTPEERFRTHKAGGRTASKIVTSKGVRLLPHLYRHLPPVWDPDHQQAKRRSSDVEKWLAEQLRQLGYDVHGGTRGIHQAPFARG